MTSLPISSNNAAAAVAVAAAAADTTTMDSSTTSIVLCAKSSSPPICSRPRLVRFAEDESERSAWSSSSQSFCPPKAVVRKHSLSADGREKLMDLLIAASNEFCLDSDNKHEEEEENDDDDDTGSGSGSGFVSRSVAATGATCGDSNNSNNKKKNNNKNKNNKNTIRISLESSSLSSSSEPNATGNETAPSHQRAAWISASHSLAQCPPQVVRRKTSLNADARSLVKTILAVVSNCESCSDSEDSALEDVGGAEPTEESSVTTTTTRRRNNENDEGDTQRPRVLRFSDEPSERGAWNSSAQSFGPPPFVTRKLSLNKGVQNFVESLVSAIGNDGKSNDNDETDDETDAVENTAGGETVTATGKTATTTDAVPIPNRNRRSSIIRNRNRNRKADESFHRGAWNSSSERFSPPPSIKRREESARHLIMEALVSAMDGGGEDCGTTEGNPNTNTKTNTNTKKTKASRRGSIVRFADADDPSERGAMRSSSHSKGPPRCVKRQLSVDAQTLIEAIVSSVVVEEEEEMDDEDFATTDAGEPTAAAGRHPSSSQEPHEADPPTPTPTPPSDSQSSELQPRRFSEPPAGTPSTDSLSVGLPPRRPSTGRSAWLNPEMRTSLRSIRPPGPPKRSDSSSKIDTSDV